jgi:colanic acid/amylovoran biosynthesis glycosyltransferase
VNLQKLARALRPDLGPRPRALIYRDFLLPASETFIKNQAEGLRRFEPYFAGLSLVDGLALPPERVIAIYGQGGLRRLSNALFNQTSLSPRLLRDVWRIEPRLVHAHFGFDASRILPLCRVLRLPLLVTFHDYDVSTTDPELLKLGGYASTYIRRRPSLNAYAHTLIAVSSFIKGRAIAKGFSAEKIVVHYIGIDVDAFQLSPAERREPIVLFVGRLVAKKGCEDLLRAMALVQKQHPEVELVVAGDGPLREGLERQAAATLGRYRFVGRVTPQEVRDWHARARVFCLPSVTAENGETEGLPISILEAQATGLPVVSTMHAGIPEAVVEGETGLLAPERAFEKLGAQIAALLENPELAGRLSRAARQRVVTNFNLKTQNARLEEIYAKVAGLPL